MALLAERWPPRRVDRWRTRRGCTTTSRDQRTTGTGDSETRLPGANMRFEGKVTRDGRFWLAEIPLLDGATQGRTRAEALEMIADWLETMVNRPDFRAEVHARSKHDFEVSGNNVAAMTALLLRRRREASGISLREVAPRLGAPPPPHAA